MRIPLLLPLLLLTPPLVGAQMLRGRAIDSAAASPITGARIALWPVAGGDTIRRSTDRAGEFLAVLPAPGRYQIAVTAIGYLPDSVSALEIPTGVNTNPDLQLRPMRYDATALITGTGRGCRLNDDGQAQLSAVLAAGARALRVMRTTIESSPRSTRAEVITRSALAGEEDSTVEVDTLRVARLTWPLLSAPVEQLQQTGFAYEAGALGSGDWVFLGPDADLLASEWFLASHCFEATLSAGGDSLLVSFRPIRNTKRVSISGQLVFHPVSLALLGMSVEHGELPKSMPRQSAGSQVTFGQAPGGQWLPIAWRHTKPISSAPRALGTPSGESILVPRSVVDSWPRPEPVRLGQRVVAGRVLLDGS